MTDLQDELKGVLAQIAADAEASRVGEGGDETGLDALAAFLTRKASREALVAVGAEAVLPLIGVLGRADGRTRKAAVEVLGAIGPAAAPAAEALAQAARNKDPGISKAALEAIATVGGDFEIYRPVLADALKKNNKLVVDALGRFGAQAAPLVRDALDNHKRSHRIALDVLLQIAPEVECADFEAEVQACLDHEREPWQRLGLQLVSRLHRPTEALIESVADLSSLDGARQALLRFPADKVKREIRSLLKSSSPPERVVGLELVQNLGSSAREFAPLIADILTIDNHAQSARIAVHTLARLLPDHELANALEPALDHWDPDVQRAARRYLAQVEVEARDSVWDAHPFSHALRLQLQRLGFKPKAPFDTPKARPLSPERPFQWAERAEEDNINLSPAIWALLHDLQYPPYELYTVWGSYENAQTFHFHDEDPVHVVSINNQRRLMHVIGDGSIGYFATIDLKDTSNDPAVFYTERWGPGWNDSNWMVTNTLSGYLRQLGSRR